MARSGYRPGVSAPCRTWPPAGAQAPVRVAAVSILDDARAGMNPDIRPQDDLFGHVNGRWLEDEEIPADKSSWGPFVQLADVAEEQVHAIIESLAESGGDDDDSRKIADLYASFMDEEAIEQGRPRPDPADPRRGRDAARHPGPGGVPR